MPCDSESVSDTCMSLTLPIAGVMTSQGTALSHIVLWVGGGAVTHETVFLLVDAAIEMTM